STKEWLVRTHKGEILGPFTQHQLLEELKKLTFSPDDEIAPSTGQWVSAQALIHREPDEVTRTSTRSEVSPSHLSRKPSHDANAEEDLTPTPDFLAGKPRSEARLGNAALKPNPALSRDASETIDFPTTSPMRQVGLAFIAVVVILALWFAVTSIHPQL